LKTIEINPGRLVVLAIFAVSAACTTTPPTIQAGPNAEESFDGLHKVDHSQADFAWARLDFDLSGYTKILPIDSGVAYTPAKNRGRSSMERSRGGPYFIDDETRARFEEAVREVFAEELQKVERFELVTEPGPDVLIVRSALLDVVSYVPEESISSMSSIYLRSVGEATLVLELRDSETGAILARSIDRRAASNMGGDLQESNSVTNAAEVRRLIRFWGSRLREGLDGFAAQ
jgi:hypothetical protein